MKQSIKFATKISSRTSFTGAGGQTFVIPTDCTRRDGELLIHGSAASRIMRAFSEEIEVCATLALIDGLVLVLSAFHHSMNYRPVEAVGATEIV